MIVIFVGWFIFIFMMISVAHLSADDVEQFGGD